MTLHDLNPAFLMELKLQLIRHNVDLDKVRISKTPLHPFVGCRVSIGLFYDPHWDIHFRDEPIMNVDDRTLVGNVEVASEIAGKAAMYYGKGK